MKDIQVGPFEFQDGRNLDFEVRPERDMVWTTFRILDGEGRDQEPIRGLTLEHAAIDDVLIDKAGTVVFAGQTARVRMANGTGRTLEIAVVFTMEDVQPRDTPSESDGISAEDNEVIRTLLEADPTLLGTEEKALASAGLTESMPLNEIDKTAKPQ